ncbi:hypothetical protein DNTS_008544 [Danionella cerebrum]|uniref:Syntaxin-binding protein 3 n=1 Tax=Danionella cerebrum TaxID=2873325 RepID=A0A553REE7_9TELE|nr:hypothetical protein DNTS_008544 [Danionella translucida]
MATGADRDLKKIVWQRLKDTIISDCKRTEVWKVLILDQFTTRLFSSCCKMSDLMSEGITRACLLVYLLHCSIATPTKFACVDAFINDFKPKPKYKAAYVFFTDYCPDELFDKMRKNCAKHIRLCKEINISFLPQEAQVFTCETPGAFKSLYGYQSLDKEQTLESIADQIVTLCATLEEYPGVRFKKDTAHDYGKKLAELVDNKLARHYDMDDNSKKKGKTQAQLLIVDRTLDPVSPVLHELTYQAMAYDLLPITDNTYQYKIKDGSTKDALLNEEDELWVKLRHMHIAEVTEQIPKLVKDISAKRSERADGKEMTIGALAQLMKKMPAFRKQVTQKTVHLNLAEDLMRHFQKNVEKLCRAEQDLAVGADAEGQKVKDPMRTLLPVLLHQNETSDKIRAVLLYIFSLNGTTSENLNKLIENQSFFSPRKAARRDRSEEETYNVSRWTPVIKDVMEDAVENKLEQRDWPFQSECPSAWNGSRAVRVLSARQKHKGSGAGELKNGSRLIIFVLGGVSYSEIRSAYEVTNANKVCQVLIGSTHILTPQSLLEDIYNLGKTPMERFDIEEGKA